MSLERSLKAQRRRRAWLPALPWPAEVGIEPRAIGNGVVEPGAVSCTLGTSGVIFAHMEHVAYDPNGRVHTFCHAVRIKGTSWV